MNRKSNLTRPIKKWSEIPVFPSLLLLLSWWRCQSSSLPQEEPSTSWFISSICRKSHSAPEVWFQINWFIIDEAEKEAEPRVREETPLRAENDRNIRKTRWESLQVQNTIHKLTLSVCISYLCFYPNLYRWDVKVSECVVRFTKTEQQLIEIVF